MKTNTPDDYKTIFTSLIKHYKEEKNFYDPRLKKVLKEILEKTATLKPNKSYSYTPIVNPSKIKVAVLSVILSVYFSVSIYAQLSIQELEDKIYFENVVSWNDINSNSATFCRGDKVSYSYKPTPRVLGKLFGAFSRRLLMYDNKIDEFDTEEEYKKKVTLRLLNVDNEGAFKNRVLKDIPVCPLPSYSPKTGQWGPMYLFLAVPAWQYCGLLHLYITLPKEEAREFKKIYPICTMTVKYGYYWIQDPSYRQSRLKPKFELYSIHLEKDGEIIYNFDLKKDTSYRCVTY